MLLDGPVALLFAGAVVVVAAAAVLLVLKFLRTTFGIKDIRGFCVISVVFRFGAKPSSFIGFTAALVGGFGGGAEIATKIC